MSDESLNRAVDIWKHAVSVQMHFNDVEMKVRNLYFTIIAASLGLVGVVQGKKVSIPPGGHLEISLALFVLLAIVPISLLFYFIDKHWYHRLLMGAVKHCGDIEEKYKEALPEIQLGSRILKESPVTFASPMWKWFFFYVRDARFRKDGKLHSDAKIEVLYKSVVCTCLAAVLLYGVVNGVLYDGCSGFSWAFDNTCGREAPVSPEPYWWFFRV